LLTEGNSQVIGCEAASEMTYTVLGGALNSAQSNPIFCYLLRLSREI